ncbi:ABC transporter permease [bacterium]|nr:ABC transporter permease [bacterium]
MPTSPTAPASSAEEKGGSSAKSSPPTEPVRQLSRTAIGWLLVAPFLIYIATFFILPLFSVVSMSTQMINDDYILVPVRTLQNFETAFNAENLPVLLRSAGYAACTTVLCLLLGYPLAWYIARYGGKLKSILLILVMLPFWTSYLIRIFSWMTILQTDGILNNLLLYLGVISQPIDMLNTHFSVILGLTYGFLPFATLPIYTSVEKIDNSILEAAADLGSSPRTTFFKVILPISMPGITAGSLLTFVPAMGDFITPDILGGVDTMMVGNLIQQQYLGFFNWPLGAAFALILMSIMLVSITAFLRMSNSTEFLA